MDYFKILILISFVSLAFAKCPENCECVEPGLGSTVYCAPKSQEQLQAQILGLPTETVELHIGDHGDLKCNLADQILDKTFQNAPKTLTNLYIEQCNVNSIGQLALSGLANLQDLYVKNNPLTKLPNSMLKGLTSLRGFILENCPLKTLNPRVFSEAPCFPRLEIIGTDIVDLNIAFGNLNCISNLNISHNHLALIQKSMFNSIQTKLVELDISYNQGVTFDEMVFNELDKLNSLSLAGISQDGSKLPEDLLSGLRRLITINIAENGFTDIMDIEMFLKEVLELRYLDASGNDLNGLNNENFAHLTMLETLHLGNSNIKVVEKDGLRGLSKLTRLDLKHNSISSLPDDLFIYSGKVKDLDLSFNSLNTIGNNAFNHLDNLNNLNLAGSNFRRIDRSMFPGNLATVTKLDLSNSSIVNIDDDAFNSLTGLSDLNLNNNEITKFSEALLKNLADKGVNLDISDNDWNCNCEMYLYREWMMENSLNYTMICAQPPERKGMDVMHMPDKEMFGCQEPRIKECCDYNVTVYEGDQADFTCTVEAGDPKPTLSIEVIDGDPLPENRTDFSSDNSTIVVHYVMVENSGNFSCTARNRWGSVTTVYHLTVEAVPTTTTEFWTTSTLLPNTTTEEYNTTTPEYNKTTPEMTTVPTGTPTWWPTGGTIGPSVMPTAAPYALPGSVIGVIIVLILIAIAAGGFLIAWYLKKRRNQEDRSSLVHNAQSPGVQA